MHLLHSPLQMSNEAVCPFCRAELMLMMPTVLSNLDKTAGSFKTGLGLTFDQLGIVHKCYTHRHAVSVTERAS